MKQTRLNKIGYFVNENKDSAKMDSTKFANNVCKRKGLRV